MDRPEGVFAVKSGAVPSGHSRVILALLTGRFRHLTASIASQSFYKAFSMSLWTGLKAFSQSKVVPSLAVIVGSF